MKTLQLVERFFGGAVCSLLGVFTPLLPSAGPAPEHVRRVVLVKFWGIGSIVLATPLFLKARQVFPKAEIVLLTLAANRGVVKMIPGVDRVELVDLGGSLGSAVVSFLRCLAWVRRQRPDVLLDLEFYTKASAVLSFFSGAGHRVGYHSPGVWRGGIHNEPVAFNVYRHVASNFLNLLEPFGVPAPKTPPEAVLTGLARCREMAQAVLGREGIAPGAFLVVNVNAGELAVERRWPRERFAELAARLFSDFGLPVVYVGAPSESEYTEAAWEMASARGARGVSLAGRLTLDELVGLCSLSTLVITNDSGPLHLAAAAGARTASFFGPETPILYGPHGERHLVLFADVSCSPCINAEHGKRASCWRGGLQCQLATSVDMAHALVLRHHGTALEAARPRGDTA